MDRQADVDVCTILDSLHCGGACVYCVHRAKVRYSQLLIDC